MSDTSKPLVEQLLDKGVHGIEDAVGLSTAARQDKICGRISEKQAKDISAAVHRWRSGDPPGPLVDEVRRILGISVGGITGEPGPPVNPLPATDNGTPTSQALVQIDAGRRALAEARSVQEVLDFRDKAEAIRVYYAQRAGSLEAQNLAAELKLRAERKLGELLAQKPPHPPGPSPRDGSRDVTDLPPRLQDLGIGKMDSSRWQRVARLPEPVFEQHLGSVRDAGEEVTTAGVLRLARDRECQTKRARKAADLAAKAEAAATRDQAATWEIREEDCLAELAKIASGSVRLVFCDPPYNLGIDYGQGQAADRLPDKDYVAWCKQWAKAAARCLTPDGSMWLLISHEYGAAFEGLLKQAGLTPRAWITWYESFGVNCTNNFNRTSRRLLYLVKDPKRFVFHRATVLRPSDRQTKYGDARADPGGKLLDDVWLDIPRLAGTHQERLPGFPTQLPVALLRRVVACASDPGDLVLDPFSGSATTGAACIELGRRYMGIERSEEFARLSRQRLLVAAAGQQTAGPPPAAPSPEP